MVATLWRQLNGSHIRELLPLKRPPQHEFHAEMCRTKGWSVRMLIAQEIVDDLEAALEQFRLIAADLAEPGASRGVAADGP